MKKIQSLFIYPIKGMRGYSIDEAQMESAGFKHDRRWMLVNEEGTFLSQRTHPELATFVINIAEDQLQVEYKGATHKFATATLSENTFLVTVFEHHMKATEVSAATSAWFSEQLGTAVRLVHHGPATRRLKQFAAYIKDEDRNEFGGTTPVSFADGYPYLIIGTASLKGLNDKLAEPLPMNRFRPNIVVETTEAHEEDNWKKITIGTQNLLVIKPCARCQVTTVNQETGTKGKEPLTTLSTYRKVGNKVNFGANTISLTAGVLRVGDVVES